MIDQPKFVAVANFTLPPNSKLNFSPGIAYRTPSFCSIRRPWIKFSIVIYPRSKSSDFKNFVSLFVKLESPQSLHQAQIGAEIQLYLDGFARNRRIECEKISPIRTTFSIDEQEHGWDKLFKRDHLFRTYPEILRRGRFQLRVVINFQYIGNEIFFEPSILGDPDCCVLTRQSRIPVHRQLLRKHSRLVDFQLQIAEEEPDVIRFHNFDPCTVHAAILFVYSGSVNPEVPLQNLHRFATSYGFDLLKKELETNFII